MMLLLDSSDVQVPVNKLHCAGDVHWGQRRVLQLHHIAACTNTEETGLRRACGGFDVATSLYRRLSGST